MTTINYNFPLISLNLQGSTSSSEIQIANNSMPGVNIQINNINY